MVMEIAIALNRFSLTLDCASTTPHAGRSVRTLVRTGWGNPPTRRDAVASRHPPLRGGKARMRLARSGSAQHPHQAVDELPLARQDLLPCGFGRKPFGAIDFREALPGGALRRPFDHGGIGLDFGRVEIALDRPGEHALAAGLAHLAQRAELALGPDPGLLLELAHGDRERILAGRIFALGDRPGARILLGPERPAGMDQQHGPAVRIPAIQQDAVALLLHALAPGLPSMSLTSAKSE